jgi:SulP family sulfate permease
MTAVAGRLFGDWVRDVSARTLRADLLAGLLGAVLVLPQGIAFATLAGLPPQVGLYTAIVPAIVAALFGSSRHVVSGPTNANSLALMSALAPLAAIGSPDYVELVFAVTVMVGVLQLLVGGLRLGAIANFISPAALLGFMSGAALLIAVFALKDVLGIYPPGAANRAGAVLRALFEAEPNLSAMAIAAATVATTLVARRLDRRAPAMLIALVVGTLVAYALAHVPHMRAVHTVGRIAGALPPLHVPQLRWADVPELLPVALALAIVALGQSISIAKAVAERSGQRIDANREFVGQGLSNVVGGFFSSYLSCGSLNRSMPNYEAGAQTPLAGVFASLLLLVLLVVAAPVVALMPMAAVGGLLLVVAASLLNVDGWRRLYAASRTDFWVATTTAVTMLVVRVEMAILIGTGLSLVAYLYRTSRPAMRTMGFDSMEPSRRFVVVDDEPHALPECPQIKLLRMEGPVYFGAASHVADTLHALRERHPGQRHLLVMAKSMNFIDVAGDAVWRDELRARRAMGGDLWFHRPRPQVLQMWRRTGFLALLGEDHVFPDKATALARIYARIDPEVCRRCTARVTWECATRAAAGPHDPPPPGAL